MSSFKKLYTDIISSGFDVKKSVPKAKDLHVYVKESYPHFLVTDNYYFVRLYFTKKAVDDFKSQFPNVNIVDLKSKTLKVKSWSVEMAKSSNNNFTSYAGVEIKLIANEFTLVKQDRPLDRYPHNIYRDQGIKTMILNQLHGSFTASVPSAALPDISKFGKGSVSQGIVKAGDNAASYTVGKTATIDMNTIFKQEKGNAAFAALAGGVNVKPKVLGGKASGKKKVVAKKSSGGMGAKIMKASANAKKTAGRISAGDMLTPGGASDGKLTTGPQSLGDFKKMMKWYNAKQKASVSKKSASKKIGKGSKK
jgi:hypothetical protein